MTSRCQTVLLPNLSVLFSLVITASVITHRFITLSAGIDEPVDETFDSRPPGINRDIYLFYFLNCYNKAKELFYLC